MNEDLIQEAVDNLDEIINELAVGYGNWTPEQTVTRVMQIRDKVLAARQILIAGRSLRTG